MYVILPSANFNYIVTAFLCKKINKYIIIFIGVVFREPGAKLRECMMNNYNYTEAALLGFNKTMNDVSAVYNSGENLLIPCATRVYNTTQHASSLVTDVRATGPRPTFTHQLYPSSFI